VLAAAGIDVGALEAGSLDVSALVGAPNGPAVLAALGEVGGETIAQTLRALEERAPKVVRKALRRALFRLEQRGVAVPPATPATAPAAATAGPEIEGWLSGFDGRGDRIGWLVRPVGGSLLLVAAQLNEPAGLEDVLTTEVSRKQFKQAREGIQKGTGMRLIEADWRVVDALLVEAHERAASPEPRRDYLRVRSRLTELPPARPAEPRSRRVEPPADDAEASALVVAGAALVGEPELAAWWPAPEALLPYLEELQAVRESPIVLSEAQQGDRLRTVLAHAAEALYPPAVLARRLTGTAYVLAETGRREAARQALATAAALEANPAGAPDLPFVATLVQQRLGRLFAAQLARQEDERRSSLVVTPGEALRARSSSHPGRSRS
jgi:hypothetical protein